MKEVTVPDIGNYAGVEIIEIAVKPGSVVKKEDTLITLETEKATMDVPSPLEGVVREVKVKVGDKVSQGSLIVLIEENEQQAEVQATVQEEKVAPQPVVQVATTVAPSQPNAAPAIQTQTVTVPDTGGANEITVIEVAVKVGDDIAFDSTLITLESEKASMDIPSPYAGVVESVLVKVGDKVSMGTPIVVMKARMENAPASQPQASAEIPAPAKAPELAPSKAPTPAPVAAAVTMDASLAHAGPATRRLARELGVDLGKVAGSGHKNRILTTDIHTYVKTALQTLQQGGGGGGLAIEKAPEVDFSQFGAIEVKPLNRIKKWTAKNLHRNWVTIPHVTQFDEADIGELEQFRQENKQAADEMGVKLTPLIFIMKAVVSGLKAFPQFNASLAANGNDLVYKKYFHLGIAVDTPNGLVVPVVRDIDNKGLFEIAKELGEISAKAREGKLKPAEMTGSSMSISSLGGIGGTAFTPIINAPDVAILGVSKAQIKPIYMKDAFVPRKMLPLSLSYDHRVIDGAEAARFLVHVVEQLQDIRKLLL
ncbi:dihydrolipoyllysine-residue acetyltransferase [Candidatus Berkiella aquae]|uniref:Acetyltransferase component of pyruvate dehydrogenase complex n=1 Tax=Candidatus Berkiella aquae TaxID=295108 RepID=A0A0Q9YWI9_9GAMM|nr:dihydrolipoyllysine-residue acetyltransferase [Candidatus Berkiella aquae]MCS5710884.1 dihydrolipoyllysine-residue acetyltransferase [Candidatus Berkiella aquae]